MSLDDGLILSIAYSQTGPDNSIQFRFSSGSEVYQTNTSEVTVVEDNMLGPSLKFTGIDSFIEITHPNFQLSGDYSVGGWFKFSENSNWVRLIGKGKNVDGNESFGLWGQPNGNAWWAGQQGTVPPTVIVSKEREIAVGAWTHVMLVRRADTLTLYYNMEELAQTSGLSGNPQNDALPLRIGYNGEYDGFAGEMAHLRLYNRALSAAEVQQALQAAGVSMLIPAISSPANPLDVLPNSNFLKTHPIEFALFDQNHHYALYIDDSPLGQPLEFEVHNNSDRNIEFKNGGGDSASATNYHFELQFRKGVLSTNTLDRLQAAQTQTGIFESSESWDLFVPTEQPSRDYFSLYLLHTGEAIWPMNTRRRLRFTGIAADASGGARGTKIFMVPNQLAFTGSDTPITGKRRQHLSIINHSGLKEIPLHVGFKGSNQVLNINGAETTLTVQIINTLRRAQTHLDVPTITLLAEKDDLPGSRLILECDVQTDGEEKAWALANASEFNPTITAVLKRRGQTTEDDNVRFDVTANTQGISPQWEITLQQDIDLNSGDMLELTIADMRSSLPSGPANLYLHYDHIPGYQDGRFVLPVIKSPLLFAGGNVSIGRADPRAKLSIEAGSGLALRVEPDSGQAVFIGRHSQNSLEFNYGYGQAINSTANISLNIDTNQTETAERYIDFRANGAGFTDGQSLMRIRETGQVFIGSTNSTVPTSHMAAGTLTLGNNNANYGGGSGWNANTAGLMFECVTNTEIAVHDYNTRVASLMYYQGDATNQITIGRDMGWGTTEVQFAAGVTIKGSLAVEGSIAKKFKRWWSLDNPDRDYDWGNLRIGAISPAQWTNSDARLKTDIQPIANALDKITRLHGITYKWSEAGLDHLTRKIDSIIIAEQGATEEANQQARDEARSEVYELLAGTEIGLLAQEVERVMPEMVRADESGYKLIRYDLITALLVEAVKEQQNAIKSLEKRLILLSEASP